MKAGWSGVSGRPWGGAQTQQKPVLTADGAAAGSWSEGTRTDPRKVIDLELPSGTASLKKCHKISLPDDD